MIRKASILLLTLLLGLFALKDAFLFAWYQIDRDTFAAALCENIDRPQLECHGKCQLPKLAEDQSASGQASAALQLPKAPGDFFLQPSVPILRLVFPRAPEGLFATECYLYHYLPLRGIFRPPQPTC